MYFTLKRFPFHILFLILVSCTGPARKDSVQTEMTNDLSLDLQGHRGCRGLLPENTIEGFIKALDLGVTTLEMDAVITADKQVILSHEPWFSYEICLDPAGNEIRQADERLHNIYKLTYEETRAYECGLKVHPRFTGQLKISARKPLLSEVIQACEAHARKTGRPLPYYNIETKCTPEGDNLYHPAPNEFASLLATVITDSNISERAIVQSFDVRTLQVLHHSHPELVLALLVENSLTVEENINLLGFTPEIYSPDFMLADEAMVAFCASKGMKLIVWTVNDVEEMKGLITLGVDGIISDYPDKFALL